jgi:hypothetical protein
MAAKYKYVYGVWLATKHGIGMQPVKGSSLKQARERFKKRFPKNIILDIHRLTSKTTIEPI